ncbi:GIN domain-containing protein [Aquisalinus flavus]|uniref:Putative auto-transporter adhesin head GIN domain-containing protein n=1 Tax=Aquisalinus flavus TaxID=1526572 RepID=A0A8J2Y6X4_9PROT|nr:DUF2807 domain-containing protein [Aquisalinus flavus]MBD0426351.1 DUF2807 domain-containing protein [Aquisalinus flavus]UNE48083.1 hypothetical protein FF099_08510 [Aquisalinus flavus]GGD08666.1 hypothetical protein GCM10011342_16860 [Aquisalinus flavus]
MINRPTIGRQARVAISAGLFVSVLGIGCAQAEVKTSDFSGFDRVMLEGFIGTVSVTIGDGDAMSVTIDDRNGGKEPVLVEKNGATVRVYSRDEPDHKDIWRQLNWQRDGSKAFRNFLTDYPVIQITLPAGTDLVADDLAAFVTIGNLDSDLTIESTIYMEGTIGNLANVDINISGAGDLMLANVTGGMNSNIAGSGSLKFDTVGSAAIAIAGSGDVSVRRVSGPAEVDIRGSGDVFLGEIGASADLDIAGSGDIEAGDVSGGLTVKIRGSGDISVGSINGPTEVDIVGNGDVSIKDGDAADMRVNISGSGDLDFGGIASNPSVSIRGSGDVYIRDYTGKVSTNGSGDITIGNIVIDD